MAENVFREDMIPVATIPMGRSDEHEFRLIVRAHRAHDGVPARIEIEDQVRDIGDDDDAWCDSGEAFNVDGSIVDDLLDALARAKARLAQRATTLPAPPPEMSCAAATDDMRGAR